MRLNSPFSLSIYFASLKIILALLFEICVNHFKTCLVLQDTSAWVTNLEGEE
jgi:hypothetical protein